MKKKFKKIQLLILCVLVTSMGFAQHSYGGYNSSRSNSAQTGVISTGNPFNLNLQLGASSPFGLPANSSKIIPELGIGLEFKKFGLQATGQYFKTGVAIDFDEYLVPFGDFLTNYDVSEENTNLMFGLNPYMNIGTGFLRLQAGIGIDYLIQTTATATANYKYGSTPLLLKYPDGETKNNLLMLKPNIRMIFRKSSSKFRLYAKASYSMGFANNEFTYTTRDLTNVFGEKGEIDGDMLEMSEPIINTGKIMPGFASIGIGVELNLASPTSVNHNSGRSNRTRPSANLDKDGGECICSIKSIEIDGQQINNQTFNLYVSAFRSAPSPNPMYERLFFSVIRNITINNLCSASPPGACECIPTCSWRIDKPDNTTDYIADECTTTYVFNQLGTYTFTANVVCEDHDNNCQASGTCTEQFDVIVSIPKIPISKQKPSKFEPIPMGFGLKSSDMVFEDGALLLKTTGETIVSSETITQKAIGPSTGGGSVTSSVAFSDYIIDNYDPNDGIPDAIIPNRLSLQPNDIEIIKEQFSMSTGEPVPGAEIYLEQEPDEEPIVSLGNTNSKGNVSIPVKPQLVSKAGKKNYALKMKIPVDDYKRNLKNSDVGVVEYAMILKTSKENIVFKVLVGGGNPDYPEIKTWKIYSGASSGPYSQSQSNLEDNGIIDITVPIDNIYGIEIKSGNLSCATISMKESK